MISITEQIHKIMVENGMVPIDIADNHLFFIPQEECYLRVSYSDDLILIEHADNMNEVKLNRFEDCDFISLRDSEYDDLRIFEMYIIMFYKNHSVSDALRSAGWKRWFVAHDGVFVYDDVYRYYLGQTFCAISFDITRAMLCLEVTQGNISITKEYALSDADNIVSDLSKMIEQ